MLKQADCSNSYQQFAGTATRAKFADVVRDEIKPRLQRARYAYQRQPKKRTQDAAQYAKFS